MKIVRWVCIVSVLMVLAIPFALFALLNSPYATQAWRTVTPYLDLNWQFESITYHAPYHFTFYGVSNKQKNLPYTKQIDIWFNPDIRHDGHWVLDSLLIDGASWDSGWQTLPQFGESLNTSRFTINQIALQNIDITESSYHLRGVNLQIKQPQWSHSLIPYGEIQFSAKHFYWQEFTLDNLLMDLHYQPQDSTLWGFSFDWKEAKISGQAEQFEHGWSLINVTLDKLKLNTQEVERLTQIDTQSLPIPIYHINSLDLLQTEIQYHDWYWHNLNLSIKEWQTPWLDWQGQGSLSLQADSLSYKEQPLIEPYLNLTRQPNSININELAFGWQQGHIQLAGSLQPDHWAFSYLNIDGVKWTLEQQDDFSALASKLSELQQIDIAALDINQSQLIQLSTIPYWQLSGFNAEGKAIHFQKTHHSLFSPWVMKNGNLDVHLTQGNYHQLLTTHATLSMVSNAGKWQLNRLFAPLEQGYIEAYAHLDSTALSQPWALNASINGLPLRTIHSYLPDPILLEGFADIEIDAQGLAGDKNMLAYSLTGSIHGALRDVVLIHKKEDETITEQPIETNNLHITAKRGMINLADFEFTAKDYIASFNANIDLTDTEEFHIDAAINTPCYQIQGHLFELSSFGETCSAVNAHQPLLLIEAPTSPVSSHAVIDSKTNIYPEAVTGSEIKTEP